MMKPFETALGAVQQIVSVVRGAFAYTQNTALTDVSKVTRVEPLTIVSRDLTSAEYLPDLLNVLLSLFSGYYMQAIDVLTQVNDIEVMRVLDRTNPDRDYTGWLLGSESVHSGLASNDVYGLQGMRGLAFEDAQKPKSGPIEEVSNAAVGKWLKVRICATDENTEKPITREVNVQVRLAVYHVSTQTAATIIAPNRGDIGFIERAHRVMGGGISFWRDFVFCQDLIDEHRRAIMTDKSGAAREIARREAMAKKSGAITKNPSLAVASNIYVITEDVARELKTRIGDISKASNRAKLFQGTAMIVAVVDRDYNLVTFYTRGVEGSTTVGISQLKNAAKNKGPDIADVMRSLQAGQAASF